MHGGDSLTDLQKERIKRCLAETHSIMVNCIILAFGEFQLREDGGPPKPTNLTEAKAGIKVSRIAGKAINRLSSYMNKRSVDPDDVLNDIQLLLDIKYIDSKSIDAACDYCEDSIVN